MGFIKLTPVYLSHQFPTRNLAGQWSVDLQWWSTSLLRIKQTVAPLVRYDYHLRIQKQKFQSKLKKLKSLDKLPKPGYYGVADRSRVRVNETVFCVIRHKRNNLFVTCYKQQDSGVTLFTESIGRLGLKGPKKRTLFAAQQVGSSAKYKLNLLNPANTSLPEGAALKWKNLPEFYTLIIEGYLTSKVKGALKLLKATNYPLHAVWIKPITPHNGIRGKKQIRTKRKRRRR